MKKTWIYGRVTGGRGGKKAKQGKKRIIIEPLRRNMKTNNKENLHCFGDKDTVQLLQVHRFE